MIHHPASQTSRNSVRRLSVLASIGLAAFSFCSVHAAVNVGDVQIGGYFSQGYLKSSNNNYPVDTKDGTADFREMGINASTNIGSHLRLGAQIFAQTLGKYGDDKAILDWASLDYNFRPEFGVRVGRLKYPRSLHSDVLDLDVVRPFILLPQSIYDSRLRDFQKSFDGAMVYGSFSALKSSFDYRVFYGDIPMKTTSGVADFFNTSTLFANPPGVTKLGVDNVRGATLTWGTPIAGLRVGLNYSELAHLDAMGPFKSVPALTSDIDLAKTRYENFSVEYTEGPWTFTGEYLIENGNTVLTLPPALRQPVTRSSFGTRSYYVSVARRLSSRFEAGTYYTEQHNSYVKAPSSADRIRDWTVALRFDYSEHLLFKIEAHTINGTRNMFNVPGISNPPAALKESMTLLAAKTTLSF